MIRARTVAAVSAAALFAMGLAGCSSSASTNSASTSGSTSSSTDSSSTQTSGASGSLDGKGGLIVVFMPSTSNVYLGADADAIKAEAAKLDYQVKIVENNFDQNQEDQQVQQFLATGQKAAAFLYWPAVDEAGINSTRLLSQKAPVFQFNQAVLPQAQSYVKAYAGVSDLGIGEEAGKMALQSLQDDKTAGRTYHGPGGKPNLINITFPTGYQNGIDRQSAFDKVVGDSFNVLTNEPVTSEDAQGGFAAASQVIPKFKDQGIDYIFTHSNNIAVGVIKALEQNGLTPGKDVTVIAGDFSGDKTPLKQGEIYSAVVQSPVIEGQLILDTAAKYLASGSVQSGSTNIPADAVKPALTADPPYQTTIMPNPPIQPSNFDSFKIWGLTIDQLEF